MNIDKKIDKEVNYIVDNIGPIVEQRNKYRYAYEILSDKYSDIINLGQGSAPAPTFLYIIDLYY